MVFYEQPHYHWKAISTATQLIMQLSLINTQQYQRQQQQICSAILAKILNTSQFMRTDNYIMQTKSCEEVKKGEMNLGGDKKRWKAGNAFYLILTDGKTEFFNHWTEQFSFFYYVIYPFSLIFILLAIGLTKKDDIESKVTTSLGCSDPTLVICCIPCVPFL